MAHLPYSTAIYLSALAFCGLLPGEASAQAILYEDGIEYPFANPDAIVALKEDLLQNGGQDALDSLPPNADVILPQIAYWGYKLTRDQTGSVEIRMRQSFDGNPTINQIESYVARVKKGGCSFVNPSAPSISVSEKKLDFSASLSGKKRACDNILGTYDIASISGSVRGDLSFGVIESSMIPNYQGQVRFNKPNIDVNVDVSGILGIDTGTLVGGLLEDVIKVGGNPIAAALVPGVGLPAWAINSELDRALKGLRGRTSDAAYYLENRAGEVNTSEYNRTLQSSQTVVWGWQPTWNMDQEATRFVGSANNLALDIVFKAPVPDFGQIELSEEGARATLRQLRGYNSQPITVHAKRGDSWSSLAREHYGSAFLSAALMSSQLSDTTERLNVGQSILIPPLWKVTIIPSRYVVKVGDSFEGLCAKWEPSSVQSCVRRLRRLNPRIVPRKLPALSVITVDDETSDEFESEPNESFAK